MPIFASRTTKTVELPFDPPHTITIQKLAGRHLKKCKEAALLDMTSFFLVMGGAKAAKEFEQIRTEHADAVKAVEQDPLASYDATTVIKFGLKAWTYEDMPIDETTIGDLDEQAMDFIAREIVTLSVGTEAARKND